MSATIIYLVVRSGFAGPFSFPVIKRINLMFCVCRMMPFAFSHLNQPFTPPPATLYTSLHPLNHSFKSSFSTPKTVTNKRLD